MELLAKLQKTEKDLQEARQQAESNELFGEKKADSPKLEKGLGDEDR